MKSVTLPAGGEWTFRLACLHDHIFVIAANPEHEPRVIGRTAQGELFVRVLTANEQAVVG